MKITINIDETFLKIQAHLASIARRVTDDKGNTNAKLFLLSPREKPMMVEYMAEALRTVNAIAPERVFSYTFDSDEGEMYVYIMYGRDADDYDDYFNHAVNAYVKTYALAQYLAMATPTVASKYNDEAAILLSDLKRKLFHKDPPGGAVLILETEGEVSDVDE